MLHVSTYRSGIHIPPPKAGGSEETISFLVSEG